MLDLKSNTETYSKSSHSKNDHSASIRIFYLKNQLIVSGVVSDDPKVELKDLVSDQSNDGVFKFTKDELASLIARASALDPVDSDAVKLNLPSADQW